MYRVRNSPVGPRTSLFTYLRTRLVSPSKRDVKCWSLCGQRCQPLTTFRPWTGTVCRDLSALCSQQVAYEDQSLPYISFLHWLCWACSALSVESVSTPATSLLETPEPESDSLALTYTGPSQLFCSWMASIYNWCLRVNASSCLVARAWYTLRNCQAWSSSLSQGTEPCGAAWSCWTLEPHQHTSSPSQHQIPQLGQPLPDQLAFKTLTESLSMHAPPRWV